MAALTHAQALTDPALTVLQDIALSVARAGVRRLLIPNGHAGNRALGPGLPRFAGKSDYKIDLIPISIV